METFLYVRWQPAVIIQKNNSFAKKHTFIDTMQLFRTYLEDSLDDKILLLYIPDDCAVSFFTR